MIAIFLRDLQRPEYLHVLLNPIPLYGLGMALFALIAATYLQSRGGQVTALALVFASAIWIWPVMSHGHRAYDHVLSLADDDGQKWLKAHEQRADELALVYYALALLSLAAIFVPKKWPGSARPLVFTTMLLAIVALVAGSYIARAGGRIRHREFRTEPPPITQPEAP